MNATITSPSDARLDALTPRLADTAERMLRGDHLELIADLFGVTRDAIATRYRRARRVVPDLPPLMPRDDFVKHLQILHNHIDRRVHPLSA